MAAQRAPPPPPPPSCCDSSSSSPEWVASEPLQRRQGLQHPNSTSSGSCSNREMAALLEQGAELHDFFPAMGGAAFGATAALLLSHLLLEATLSPFFSGCVSLLLLFVAFLSIQRALTIEAVPPPDLLGVEGEEADDFAQLTASTSATSSSNSSSSNSSRSARGSRVAYYEAKLRARKTLYGLSIICCIGAVCCLLLPRCRGSLWIIRAPIYCLLGNALFLVLVLAVADGLHLYLESASTNNHSGFSGTRRKRERVCHILMAAGSSSMPEEYTDQLCILLCGSLTLGGAFGFFFAVLDGGDAMSHVQIVRYRYVCFPLSVLICSILGVALNRTGPPKGGPTLYSEPTVYGRCRNPPPTYLQQQQQRQRQEDFVDDAAEDDSYSYYP